MLLVFLILGIIAVFVFLFLTLKIRISIKGEKQSQNLSEKMNSPIKLKVSFYTFGGIKIASKQIKKEDVTKLLEKQKANVWNDFKKYEPKFFILLKDLEKMKVSVKKLYLSIHLGTEQLAVTSFLVVLFSTFLSILLAKFVQIPDKKKIQYQILPYYQEKNQYHVKVDCIIQVKMVHIIYVIYRVIKRKEIDEHGKSSNRRSYEYSYE